jgi:hypothetical protein
MSEAHGWILSLAPGDGSEDPVEPACSAVTIAVATAVLGPGPVAWAVRTAVEMTEEIVKRVPEHGGGPTPFATLRSNVESIVLLALRGLHEDLLLGNEVITEQSVAAGAEFARRGIPLDRVLRGVRLGHAHLHRALIAVVDTLPEPVRSTAGRGGSGRDCPMSGCRRGPRRPSRRRSRTRCCAR